MSEEIMIQVTVVQGDENDEGNPWLANVTLHHSWEEAIEMVRKLPPELLIQVTMIWN